MQTTAAHSDAYLRQKGIKASILRCAATFSRPEIPVLLSSGTRSAGGVTLSR